MGTLGVKATCLAIAGSSLLLCTTTFAAEVSLPSSLFCQVTTFQKCSEPFGATLGQSSGVSAYSNCNDSCILPLSASSEFQTDSGAKNFTTGLTWQCVEFARRFWMQTKGVKFGDVATADMIWQLKTALQLSPPKDLLLLQFANGSTEKPQKGDLLVYAKNQSIEGLRNGHVAVIVDVEPAEALLRVAEQNFTNQRWEVPQAYARTLTLQKRGNQFIVVDSVHQTAEIFGWMRASGK